MKSRLAMMCLLLASPISAFAQSEAAPPRRGSVLTVRGSGEHRQKPDFARFDVIVATKGKTLVEAAESHKDRATRGLAALRDLEASGLQIETSSFRIDEEKRPPYVPVYPGQPIQPAPQISKTPFTARTSITLNATSIDGLNAMVSRLADAGLFEIQTIKFKAGKERAALNAARRAAMTDALEQAEAYSEAGGLKLVEIIEVTDGEARPSEIGSADLPLARSVQIIPPATLSFDASVNVTWRIAPR